MFGCIWNLDNILIQVMKVLQQFLLTFEIYQILKLFDMVNTNFMYLPTHIKLFFLISTLCVCFHIN